MGRIIKRHSQAVMLGELKHALLSACGALIIWVPMFSEAVELEFPMHGGCTDFLHMVWRTSCHNLFAQRCIGPVFWSPMFRTHSSPVGVWAPWARIGTSGSRQRRCETWALQMRGFNLC